MTFHRENLPFQISTIIRFKISVSIKIQSLVSWLSNLVPSSCAYVYSYSQFASRKGQNRLRISRGFRSSEARKARGQEPSQLYLEAQRESVYGRGALYYSIPPPFPRVDALATKLSSKDELSAGESSSRSGELSRGSKSAAAAAGWSPG